MSTELSKTFDIRQLVRWLGSDGARAGLLQSKVMTVESLQKVAQSLGIRLPAKTNRNAIVDEIVRIANRKIEKSLDELLAMDQEQLVEYFERVNVEAPELLDILKQLDLSPQKEGRRRLIELAAKEISETGRFQRIAGKSTKSAGDIVQRNFMDAEPRTR